MPQSKNFPLKKQNLIKQLVKAEAKRQKKGIQLIASENDCPKPVRDLVGSILTNKYAEGYPGKRYYSGNEFCDQIETLAIETAKKVFKAEHVNVQPHSGSTANAAIYLALLQPGDKILSLSLNHGGHLSHGHPKNVSGKLYNFVHYSVDTQSEQIDWDLVAEIANQEKPKLIVGGFTAYPRQVDFSCLGRIAKNVGAYAMADISHISGLVAAGFHPSPFPHCDVAMTTTHKTLHGPRGAIILCRKNLGAKIDSAVFPGTQGGPLMHVIAGKAWALLEAQKPSFKTYQKSILANAQAMVKEFKKHHVRLVSGGTDTHLLLIDTQASFGINGREAAEILERKNIFTNYNLIPFDTGTAREPSGLRLGTAWITARGYTPKKSAILAKKIVTILKICN